ncbi:MAG: CBS domain-containing protein [Syntrophomonadaceae bacterium]|nr:CBS domain-containing protein [Syntrophomonadaceae bacterium]
MEIIVSHNHLDFDGLASMLAAQRLYPRAELVFVGGLSGNVQRFMSLHKDSLLVKRIKQIPLDQVERVIVVDTNSPRRLGELANWIRNTSAEIHLYDHHPEAVESLSATVKVTDTVGAGVTLLVEKIQQNGLKLSRFEATVLALGIYEDTGSLTFTTTTVRDVRAVAYLLENGANLSIVANFIELSFTDEQKALFNQLLASVQHRMVNGVDVLLASAKNEETVGSLDFITHKLGDLDVFDVLITMVEMGNRVYIVARSRTDSVDVGEVCTVFGGGGHPMAASATIKGRSLESILEEMERVLEEKTHPPLVARDIMSSPVKTVSMFLSLEETEKIMLRYGHTGLPVQEEGKVVGVISRRDIDKGTRHGLGHSPVKGYMTRQVISVAPDTPLSELQYLMVKHDIGRLPVIENGLLIGIVSRSDILRTYHGQDYPEDHKILYDDSPEEGEIEKEAEGKLWFNRNWRERMTRILPAHLMYLLEVAGNLADKLQMSVYVVGGFVRDLWLGYPNLDVDLVVEGQGPEFARELARVMGGEVRVHERFQTAMVILPDGFRVDIATARVEYYEYPAALPQVECSNLRHDMYRRDFTINAMAIQLNSSKFGDLVDFFGGRRDLQQGLVRVLYNLSFVEDPTRIIRAIRFEQRYGLQIEDQTLQFLEDAIYRRFLKDLSTVRVKEELTILLSEPNPISGMRRLVELGAMSQILPEVEFNHRMWRMLGRVVQAQEQVRRVFPKQEFSAKEVTWLIYWMILFHKGGSAKVQEISSKYRLTRSETSLLKMAYEAEEKLMRLGVRPAQIQMSTLHRILYNCSEPVFIYLIVLTTSRSWHNQLLTYLKVRTKAHPEINGRDLIKLGLKPGPKFKWILDRIHGARLDGQVRNREEELALVEALREMKEEAVQQ